MEREVEDRVRTQIMFARGVQSNNSTGMNPNFFLVGIQCVRMVTMITSQFFSTNDCTAMKLNTSGAIAHI